jgi:hypothetical protein
VLGVDKNTLRSWPADRVPYTTVGVRGDRRYRPEDLEAFVRARRQGARRAEQDRAMLRATERIRSVQSADRSMAVVVRTLEGAGRQELAQRLRSARAVLHALADTRD